MEEVQHSLLCRAASEGRRQSLLCLQLGCWGSIFKIHHRDICMVVRNTTEKSSLLISILEWEREALYAMITIKLQCMLC